MNNLTPTNTADLQNWMAQNLGVESVAADLKTKPVHNVWVVPRLIERHIVTESEMYEKIEGIVCKYFRIQPEELRAKPKLRRIDFVMCRQLIFYFVHQKTKMSAKAIGEIYGKDHATVLHAYKVIKDYLYANKSFAQDFEDLEISINKYNTKQYEKDTRRNTFK